MTASNTKQLNQGNSKVLLQLGDVLAWIDRLPVPTNGATAIGKVLQMAIKSIEDGTATVSAQEVTDERKQFEQWYEADAMPQESDWFRRHDDGEYEGYGVAMAWDAWQARASIKAGSASMDLVTYLVENDHGGYDDCDKGAKHAFPVYRAPVAEQSAGAAEQVPVLHQIRMRPKWCKPNEGWTKWEDVSKESYEDYKRLPIYNDWEREARALYVTYPPVSDKSASNAEEVLAKVWFHPLPEWDDYDIHDSKNLPNRPDGCNACIEAVIVRRNWCNQPPAQEGLPDSDKGAGE